MADSGRITPEEAETLELYDPGPASRVRMRSVKLFTDGALGSWGAALLSPYTDKPEVSGIMRLPEEELDRAARTWWSRGWGVVSILCMIWYELRMQLTKTHQNIHAIGDRANKAVLDVFEGIARDADEKDAVAKGRPRIEHSQIMQMADLKRSGKLGGA